MKCPDCDGEGVTYPAYVMKDKKGESFIATPRCSRCEGKGEFETEAEKVEKRIDEMDVRLHGLEQNVAELLDFLLPNQQ